MNLADIRKKSQQERKDSAGFVDAPMEEAIVAIPEMVADEVKHYAVEVEPETLETEQGAAIEGPVFPFDVAPADSVFPKNEGTKDPERITSGFDPMALIIAGRQDSADGEDTSYDAGPVTKESGDFQEFLCFRVSSEKYAINILDIKEIIKPREITEVPRVPSFISGVLSLRGIIIPVFNMRTRLGLSPVTGLTKERILVIKKNEELCGLMVDEVVQVVRIGKSTIEPPPAVLDAIDREFVSGIGRYEGMMLILLNLENILDINLC